MYTTRTTLLEKIAAGDEIGWREFFETYRKLVIDLAKKEGIPEDGQSDILQEVMLGVFHNGNFIYRRDTHGKFRTWFGGIIRNKIRDHQRASGKQKRLIEAKQPETEVSGKPEFEAAYREEYCRHLLDLALSELKARVEPEIYETFLLCRTGCSDREAAEKLGLKSNTVTIRKRRCVEILNGIIRRLNESDPELGLPPL